MHVVIFITTANKPEAEKIATALVDKKLVACVNIVAGVTSLFWWEGKVDRADEVLIIAKSAKEKFAEISSCVKALHSYDVPEIIALPILEGYKPYLDWIDGTLNK